jgi:filamentous hemagglutinin family protein
MLRHPGAIQPSRLFLGAILTGCFLLLVSLAVSDAQVPSAITPDGMLDTVVIPDGRVFNITGGTRPDQGPNLFHSFGQFDVGTGDTAHFVGQPGIDNIISRVTGGSESLIDGRLQSDASLFLLNPSGLMFGPNATLDVNGSFHASTADVLRFVDGATFSAHLNEKSTLTVAVPSAFGFLGADPAGIIIEESTLQVPEGETLSIVGGDIEITGGPQGFLAAPAGQIHIVSVASPGEVVPEISAHGSSLNVESFEHLGNVTISDLVPNDTNGERGGIDTSGERGGTIAIRSGNLLIEDSFILADTLGDIDGPSIGREQGGNVTVQATEMVSLDGSSIYTNTQGQGEGAGDAGTVVVEAPRVTLTGGAQIQSVTFGSGQGGNVTVRATDTVSLEGSFIYVNAVGQGEAAGAAGTVVMEALRVTLTGGAQIQSATLGQGRGGDIALSAPHVQLTDRSSVSAESTGSGEAGNIHIAAQEVALRGGSAVTTTAGQGEASGGNILIGGTITDDGVIIEGVEALTLDGSQMTANTDTGSGANINVGVQRLVLDGASALTANTGAGTGGNLRVGGAVSADGTITARVETVVLRGSRLTANAETGTGGRIDVVTEAFLADPASIINASSQAGGIDGVVNVEAVVSNLSEIVTPLPPDFASAASLLRDQCAARLREGQLSSLVVSGRAGMPARPGGILPSPVFRAERGPMVTSKQAEPLAGAVAFHPEGDGAPAHDMRQGWMSFQHGDFEQAVLHWQQAVRALEREGEADQQSVALAHLAHAYQKLGHYQQALQRLQAAQTLAEKSGDRVLKRPF